jgi:N-acetyl-beta-hexosaminidase
MREAGLRSEEELQRDLVLRIGAYLAAKGKETIVWNDVLNGGMLPDYFIVQQWMDGEDKTRRFMENGGRVICSETKAYYFDYPYGRIDVRKIWQYPRIPEWAAGYESRLLGIECPLWTERVTNLERAGFLLFPRLAAAGLKAHPGPLSWEDFRESVRETCRQIRDLGLTCAPEEWWDMPADRAEADIRADEDRIYAPEALPYEQKQHRWTVLDREEGRRIREGETKASVLREGDQTLAEICR